MNESSREVDDSVASLAAPHIVVIGGGSAGAMKSLSLFFQIFPITRQDFAFVIAFHFGADAETQISELFSIKTTMPLQMVSDGMPLRPGNIYVLPPDVRVEMHEAICRLVSDEGPMSVTTFIDRYITSLASDQRERVIGIVMSGADGDNTVGLRAIKAEGGLVIAQSPNSAEDPIMPQTAIESGLVEFVLPVQDMAAAVLDYADQLQGLALPEHAAHATPEADDQADVPAMDLEPVFNALAGAGTEFRGYKRCTLRRRVARRMAVNRIDRFEKYCQLLSTQLDEVEALSQEMMIGVTAFFRDAEAWDMLAERVLRPLLDAPEVAQPLRIWVPGCATGEEAYSISMLLTEEIEKRKSGRSFMIFASDVNRTALTCARLGIYSPDVALQLGEARLSRFFQPCEHGYQVRRELRESILFTSQNLTADPPFSSVDLISCRNLLIYLEPLAQQRVFTLFHFALNPECYLFLGRAESSTPDATHFQEVSKKWRIYQHAPLTMPSASIHRHTSRNGGRGDFPNAGRVGGRNKGYAELVNAALLSHHQAAVLANTAHQVIYVSGAVDCYLGQSEGEPTNNILDMTRERLRMRLRIVLRRASQNPFGDAVSEAVLGDGVPDVQITVSHITDQIYAGSLLLILFSQLPFVQRIILPPVAEGGDSDLWHLERELRTTQAALGFTIGELEESNSELRVSNEEMLSINEELRSANEELETSKEELQVVNEQLNQVNYQLEQKVLQLEALTDDFTSLLASTEIATVLIDRHGLLKRFTPSAAAIFGLGPTDMGRTVRETLVAPLGDTMMPDVERVLSGAIEQAEKEVKSASGQWYVRRITPYIAIVGQFPAGTVVTWTDITHIKKVDERAGRLAAVVQDSNDAVTVFDLNGRFLAWNNAATVMYGYTEAEALCLSVSDLLPPGAREDHHDFILHALDNQALHSYETRRVAKDGRVLEIWLSMSILLDEAGNAVSVSSTERDLTDRGLSTAFLRQRADQLALADRRKNEFLAMLGHELRNPLAALISAGHLFSLSSVDETKKSWAAGVIQRQGRAMLHLVNDMLDIARIAAGQVELHQQTVALKTIVQSAIDVCQPIIQERRHRLSVSLPETPVYLNADPTRLSQVMENILINAAKFTAPGGLISLHAATSAAQRLTVRIKDNGRGISAGMLNQIFDMFVQAPTSDGQRYNGLGVGLSVVRRLVELHGGTVRAMSDGHSGSEFVIDLPLETGAIPASVIADFPMPVVTPCKRILVIDDNRDAGEALALQLAHEGHDVRTASDGKSGLTIAQAFVPEVVLLDIGMPGMDGYAVAKALRQSDVTRGACLIAITGFGMPSDRLRSAEAGVDQHMVKPVDRNKLLHLLAAIPERPALPG
ncbi:two-component system CheB/CheR fusion protein [Robbsia andropogonis]|uniref:CheR family methyltransferase n=1 Tax=Robbsia andropogonis TaxID=28092 RepID=UPI003D209E55